MDKWMSNSRVVICGLDIGSTHVTVTIADALSDGFKVIGLGQAKNSGVRQGAIVDITKTTMAIKKAKKEAELMSGRFVSSAWVSCGGLRVRSRDSHGMVALESKEVISSDLEQVIKTARAIALPEDQEIIHVLPQEFFVDGQGGIKNPLGIQGLRMEVNVHIISVAKAHFPNAIKCVETADLSVEGFVLQQLASSLSVLSEDEKELGVCLVDIGGGTSDLICYKGGAVIHAASIPIGGIHVTQDLSIGLKTAPGDAEAIKVDHGCCLLDPSEEEEIIEVPAIGDHSFRKIPLKRVCDIIEPRADEFYKLIFCHLEKENLLQKINAGLVITGGVGQLKGFIDLGRYNYDLPIRLGIPIVNSGIKETLSVSHMATSVGLIQYGYNQLDSSEKIRRARMRNRHKSRSFMMTAKDHIKDLLS